MRVCIQVCPDERLCIASERHVLGSRRKTVLLAGAAPAVVGCGLLFFGRQAWAPAVELILLAALNVTVLALLLPRFRGRRWARSPGHPRLIELTREGVRTVSHSFELTRRWELVGEVVDLPGQTLLMLSRRHYIAIPTDALSAAEAADLRTLLDGRHALVAA